MPPARAEYEPAPRSFWWVWVLVAIVAGAAIYFVVTRLHASAAASGKSKFGKGGAVPVVVAQAREGNFNIYINGLGTVTAFNTVTLHSRVDGELIKVNFTEGQLVHQGELLAEIDPHPYQAQLLQAQGQLAKDQANLVNAQKDLARYEDLLKQNLSVTQQQVDTQQALVNQLQGAIEADKGQIQTAQVNVNYCEITAPITGRIGLRTVDQGNIVRASDTGGMAVIAQLQPIAVIFTIPQEDIPRIEQAMKGGNLPEVDAYGRDLTQKLATGKVLATDNEVDPNTGTLRIKASFPNEDNTLFPNEFVNARMLVDTLKGAIIVPSAAIQHGPDTNPIYVYVVKPDNTVQLKDVKIGPTEGDQTVVESGLAAGEKVVTEGVDKLQSGSKVTIGKHGGASIKPANASTRPAGASRGAAGSGRGGKAVSPSTAPSPRGTGGRPIQSGAGPGTRPSDAGAQ